MAETLNRISFDEFSANLAGIFELLRTSLSVSSPTARSTTAFTMLYHDLTVVTRNTRHFSRVPDLKLYQG
jgi:predicted nucleic acid-binding protein